MSNHDSVTVSLGSEHEGWPYTLTCSCGTSVPVLALTSDVVPTWWVTHRAAHDAPVGQIVADLRAAQNAPAD